ncbi:MAG TPA: ribosome biogenesis GTP-binding protein YihA/YsxC [Chitinophagaceae bacterium]|nr:YihA family ribosome biogenesis GTP-binding protein [Chitinophagaceae bacterium]MCB9054224.1 YihA family ribosome biogenesis GTP-binding protein [Chitinophagales bacterium]HPG12624.1 ribosome biogenesis GTP-binding protein YihA/YsxC [Chitinophagaceae bacterium]HRX94129.1 ribosome biogenesis GTP-binding protein YihA/YsxC [Chitinophagaceae bacterium]
MDIISAEYLISSATHKQCPKADRPEYAFIGRSNVGKSSLINMITGKKALAKTSAKPGKTQLINHFKIRSSASGGNKGEDWYLVDLPGYGYATVSQKARRNWGNMIESYIRKRENLGLLFVLIDSRHEPQKIDIEFINQLGEWQVPFVLVFTKTDKSKPGATKRRIENFMQALSDNWEVYPQYFVTSAVTKDGREEILDHIGNINKSFTQV